MPSRLSVGQRGSLKKRLEKPCGTQDEYEVDAATVLDLDVPRRLLQPHENV
jgi:hypothetical protein